MVLLICGGVAFVLAGYFVRQRLDEQFEQRALAVATSVAALPTVQHELKIGDPQQKLRKLAQSVRLRSNVRYVVIADSNGIRYSHPNPDRIGRHVSTPFGPVLEGRNWVGVQTGTLGRSARGKAPVFGSDHQVIGEVSVGILESRVKDALWGALSTIGLYLAGAVLIGAGASLMLSRRMKRQTFGLELDEIADLLQEREAMLHGVREGVVALDTRGKVRLVNDEARRLLALHEDAVGQDLTELLPDGRLRDVLTGDAPGEDAIVVTRDRVVMLNRMPVGLSNRHLGAVVTMRDRTETDDLLRQVNATTALTSTLRAQNHEFSNRLHALLGLLELERYEEASQLIVDLAGGHAATANQVVDRVRDATLAALLIAKVNVASEKGVELLLDPESRVTGRCVSQVDAVTVVGNLIDNAVDAAASGPADQDSRRWVSVDLRQHDSTLLVSVYDSGPGIPHALRGAVFTDGFSTKSSGPTRRRGVGLALVSQAVHNRQGVIRILDEGKSGIHASLPGLLREAPRQRASTDA